MFHYFVEGENEKKEKVSKKNIKIYLITGTAGFIGANFLEYFLKIK